MRIIDKRKDFYDGSVLFSVTPVWVRKEHKSFLEDNHYKLSRHILDRLKDVYRAVPSPSFRFAHGRHFPYAVVGFCGHLYVVYYKNTHLGRPQDIVSASKPSTFVPKWNSTEKSHGDKIILDDKKTFVYFRSQFNDDAFAAWDYEHYKSPFMGDLHRVIKSPVFMITHESNKMTLTVNPLLVTVGFQVVLNSWTMVQELERYVGNDLVDTPLDDFKMSDELKRDSKGMDNWSFKQRGPKARKAKKK